MQTLRKLPTQARRPGTPSAEPDGQHAGQPSAVATAHLLAHRRQRQHCPPAPPASAVVSTREVGARSGRAARARAAVPRSPRRPADGQHRPALAGRPVVLAGAATASRRRRSARRRARPPAAARLAARRTTPPPVATTWPSQAAQLRQHGRLACRGSRPRPRRRRSARIVLPARFSSTSSASTHCPAEAVGQQPGDGASCRCRGGRSGRCDRRW